MFNYISLKIFELNGEFNDENVMMYIYSVQILQFTHLKPMVSDSDYVNAGTYVYDAV